MTTKIIKTVTLISTALLVAGCGKSSVEPPHVHTLPDTYETDEFEHWKVCTDCGEIVTETKQYHNYDKVLIEDESGKAVGKECKVCKLQKKDTRIFNTGTFSRGDTAKVGTKMYDLEMKDFDENPLKFSELLEGKEAIFINFTYASCYWCSYEAPFINEVYNSVIEDTTTKYTDKVAFLGICDATADGASLATQKSFVTSEGFQFPFVRDTNTTNLSRYFPVNGYPTSVLIDRYGYLANISSTFSNKRACSSFLDTVLGDDYKPSYVK